MRMHHIVICSLSVSTLFFHVISSKARFPKKKKVIEHKIRFFRFLYNFCLKHFSVKELSEICPYRYIGHLVKYPLFLSNCNEYWIFSTDFSKNTQISNIIKFRPVGAALFHEDGRKDGQTNITKLSRLLPILWRRLKIAHSATLFAGFVCTSQQTAIITLCNINWLFFITEMKIVHSRFELVL